MTWRRIITFATLAVAAGLLVVAPAQADFHLIKVREVYPGPGDDTGFVMLQMYEQGENQVAGHILTVYSANGTLIHQSVFQDNVTGVQNQSTILIGDSNVGTVLGVDPDLVDPELDLPAAGGAVCWNSDGEPSDCVSWGGFSGNDQLSNSADPPVAPGGIGPGQAILRTISPGCVTLLDPGDDSDHSAADFTVLPNSPNPRNNATPPTEHPCAGLPPDTSIDERPPARSNSHTAAFTYGAPTATGFKCRIDAVAFAVCSPAGRTFTNVPDGTHTFQVLGENADGPDQTPASFTWTIDTVAPTSTIDTHPVDPSPGATAAFTFHASEATSKFECSLTPQGGADSFSTCVSGKTYNSLANGVYAFKLRATDLTGNPQVTPTQFTWTVDNVVADTTPPETTISAKPPDPSTSATAVFGYSSNEPGSTFECALDGAAFAGCAPGGVTFNGLANGPHTFKVRAIDPSKNVDQTPAAYTFSVAVENKPPQEEPPPPAPVAPQTSLLGKPVKRTHDRTPSFRFRADVAGATFQCAVDKGRFKPCRSPFTTAPLKPGRHTFSVKAMAAGLADPTPTKVTFQVLTGAR